MPDTFKPLELTSDIDKARRNLPHWYQEGCTYFVTFRLADSLPQAQLKAWLEERYLWLKLNPRPWTEATESEYAKRFTQRMQDWLDAGYGSCALCDQRIQQIVADAFQFFDQKRYGLGDFVIMPNHVHVLVAPLSNFSLSSILHSWKSFSAKEANGVLGRTGEFWMGENFDHAVRSFEQLRRFQKYIAENPAKPGLKVGTFLLRQVGGGKE